MEKQHAALGVLLAVILGYWLLSGSSFDGASLQGKRILITGSSSGIGERTAYEYSRHGAKLLLAARRESNLQNVAKRCRELGAQQVDYVVVDFSKPEDRNKVVQTAEKVLGGIDHLILDHVAYHKGWWEGSQKNVTDLQHDLNVAFISYVDIASKSLKTLIKSKGNIGVVSSIDAKFALGKGGTHTFAKFAGQGFFHALRQELYHKNTGVSVSLFIFGPIATTYPREIVSYFYGYAGDVDEAATAIVQGTTNRVVETYYPFSSVISVYLHKFFPRWVENYSFATFGPLLTPAA